MIFKSEKLDQSDEMVDTGKNLKINDSKYYESNTATASDTHCDITLNPEKVTHTSNNNEAVTHTSNIKFEQKLLSNRTIPFLPLAMNLRIGQGIEPILLVPQMILMPEMKEVVVSTASGSSWVNRNPRQVIWKGVDESTPRKTFRAVSLVEPPTPFLIGIVATYPPYGINAR